MIDISTIIISHEILNFMTETDEFKGAWKLFGKLALEQLQALKKIATIESVGSSTRIEGAKLSDKEVEEFLSRVNTYSFHSKDEEEVAGYAFVCEEIFGSYEHISLTENTIKQLHSWLLKYSSKDERHRGEYKKFPNHVEAFDAAGKSLGIVFETSTPFETPMKMQELVYWTREALENKKLHPLLVIALFVVNFLAVHPFQDGNGRLSRILTSLLLLQQGYLYAPYSSLENVIEQNKESYYLALRKTQTTLQTDNPDFQPWITFFLRALLKQKQLLEKKVEKEKILHLHISEISAQLLALIQKHGRLSVTEMVNMTNINKNTVKKHVQDLVKNQQIVMHGKGKATWYTIY